VAFVMPAGRDLDTPPPPNDPRVHLRTVPQQVAAALKFSGWGNSGDLDKRGRQLLRALEGTPWQPVGPTRLARFNAPYIPPFLRQCHAQHGAGGLLLRRPRRVGGQVGQDGLDVGPDLADGDADHTLAASVTRLPVPPPAPRTRPRGGDESPGFVLDGADSLRHG